MIATRIFGIVVVVLYAAIHITQPMYLPIGSAWNTIIPAGASGVRGKCRNTLKKADSDDRVEHLSDSIVFFRLSSVRIIDSPDYRHSTVPWKWVTTNKRCLHLRSLIPPPHPPFSHQNAQQFSGKTWHFLTHQNSLPLVIIDMPGRSFLITVRSTVEEIL